MVQGGAPPTTLSQGFADVCVKFDRVALIRCVWTRSLGRYFVAPVVLRAAMGG